MILIYNFYVFKIYKEYFDIVVIEKFLDYGSIVLFIDWEMDIVGCFRCIVI